MDKKKNTMEQLNASKQRQGEDKDTPEQKYKKDNRKEKREEGERKNKTKKSARDKKTREIIIPKCKTLLEEIPNPASLHTSPGSPRTFAVLELSAER